MLHWTSPVGTTGTGPCAAHIVVAFKESTKLKTAPSLHTVTIRFEPALGAVRTVIVSVALASEHGAVPVTV